jgi:hypothetical protein
MADTPGALQLRLLETIVEVAAEKNSTLVLPFPVELLRFLEKNTGLSSALSAVQAAEDKSADDTESAGSPDATERLSSAPEVAAIEAKDPVGEERPPVRVANRLSQVPRNSTTGKHAS